MANLAEKTNISESTQELLHDFTATAHDFLKNHEFEQMFRDMEELKEKYNKLQAVLQQTRIERTPQFITIQIPVEGRQTAMQSLIYRSAQSLNLVK